MKVRLKTFEELKPLFIKTMNDDWHHFKTVRDTSYGYQTYPKKFLGKTFVVRDTSNVYRIKVCLENPVWSHGFTLEKDHVEIVNDSLPKELFQL